MLQYRYRNSSMEYPMARYPGQPRNLTQKLNILLDETTLLHANNNASALGVPRNEGIRRAIDLLHASLFSTVPTSATIQPIEQEPTP